VSGPTLSSTPRTCSVPGSCEFVFRAGTASSGTRSPCCLTVEERFPRQIVVPSCSSGDTGRALTIEEGLLEGL